MTAAAASEWPWPDALDALVAAPQHHTLLLENRHVRVLEAFIRPGDRVPVHTHRWPSLLHILSWSDFIRRDESGTVLSDSRLDAGSTAPPSVVWSEPLPPHSLENVGTSEIRVISVELKQVAA